MSSSPGARLAAMGLSNKPRSSGMCSWRSMAETRRSARRPRCFRSD